MFFHYHSSRCHTTPIRSQDIHFALQIYTKKNNLHPFPSFFFANRTFTNTTTATITHT